MDFVSMLLAGLGIGLLIFIHELGHFLAARLAGVRVEVFSLGFGKKLWGRHFGNTEFTVRMVPFGGFVMVAGADPSDRRYPRHECLYAKSVAQRALFWSGGVIMNTLLALVVFPIVFSAGVVFQAPVVGTVQYGSAAWEAALQPGDRILAVGGHEVRSFDNLMVEVALHGHHPLDIEIQRGEARLTVPVSPQFDAASGLYQLGVEVAFADLHVAVQDGSAGAAAGLRNGDVVEAWNGQPLDVQSPAFVQAYGRGEPLALGLRRGTEHVDAILTAKASTEKALRLGVQQAARRVLGIRTGTPFVRDLGLAHGDVLLAVDGRAFLSGSLADFGAGPDVLRMQVLRDGKAVVLESRASPEDRQALARDVAIGGDGSMRVAPQPDTPAAAAGLQPCDRIVSVDGKAIATWADLKKVVERADGSPLHLRVQRVATSTTTFFDPATQDLPPGELVELTITPTHLPSYDYGFTPVFSHLQQEVRATGFGDAMRLGFSCSIDLIKQSYVTLKRLLTGDVGAKNLGGFIRITQVSYQAAQRGPSWFFYFLALISLNLAFVNLLPVPVLDGGHVLFLLIEKVKGSPVSSRVLNYSQITGLVFVLLLVLFVTYNDILRLL